MITSVTKDHFDDQSAISCREMDGFKKFQRTRVPHNLLDPGTKFQPNRGIFQRVLGFSPPPQYLYLHGTPKLAQLGGKWPDSNGSKTNGSVKILANIPMTNDQRSKIRKRPKS